MRSVLEADQFVDGDGIERLELSPPENSLIVPSTDMYRVSINVEFEELTPEEMLQVRVLQNDQLILQLIEFPPEKTEVLTGERVLDLYNDDEISVEVQHVADDFVVGAGQTDIDEIKPGAGTVLELSQLE